MKQFLVLLTLLSLGGCASPQSLKNFDPQKNAVVAYYPYHEENAVQEKTLFAKGMEDFIKSSFLGEYFWRNKGHYTFFSMAFFKSQETGERMNVGCIPNVSCSRLHAGFDVKVIPASRYNLIRSMVALDNPKYDAAKCGNIGFVANPGDVIVMKGISPAAVRPKREGDIFNTYMLPKFDTLPDSVLRPLKEDKEMATVFSKGKTRIVAPSSNDPAAFQKCAREMGGPGKLVPF